MSSYIIIHIAGAVGSGKSFLGTELKTKYADRIIVKEFESIQAEFLLEFYADKKITHINHEEFQSYITNYIKRADKILIIVGANYSLHKKGAKFYYNIHSQYNYYIDIDDMILVTNTCLQFIKDLQQDASHLSSLTENNEAFVKTVTEQLKQNCRAKDIIKNNNKLKQDYKTRNYKLMPRQDIYREITDMLDNLFKYLDNRKVSDSS